MALKWHATFPVVITAALDSLIRVWDARSGTCLRELSGHQNIVTNLDYRQVPFRVGSISESEQEVTGGGTEKSESESGSGKGSGDTASNSKGEEKVVNVDVVVSVSDDCTARVFHLNISSILNSVTAK